MTVHSGITRLKRAFMVCNSQQKLSYNPDYVKRDFGTKPKPLSIKARKQEQQFIPSKT